jgi:nucleoid-associated protein YgaU
MSLLDDLLDPILETRTHRVQRGETLAGIAQTYYGDPGKWAVIYQHNDRYIRNPNQLDPGVELVVPHLLLPGLAQGLFR